MTYNEYIQDILDTRGRFACGEEYCERHHIIPRCMNGDDSDDNLIDLYAREHYEAHKLLAEENPDNEKILFAWWSMSMKSPHTNDRYQLTADEYEAAKIALSNAQSKIKKEIFKDKRNHPMYGKTHSKEAKEKMSKAKKGKPSSRIGQHVSEKGKERLRKAKLGSKWSDEQHKKWMVDMQMVIVYVVFLFTVLNLMKNFGGYKKFVINMVLLSQTLANV